MSNTLCSICVTRPKTSNSTYCTLCLSAYNKLYREYLKKNPDAEQNQKPCSKCGKNPRMTAQRWCLPCDREYRRENGQHRRQIMSAEARKKERTRAITRKLIKSGVLQPKPCQFCEDPNVESHHPDYDKPMLVWWVCRDCHRFKVHDGKI